MRHAPAWRLVASLVVVAFPAASGLSAARSVRTPAPTSLDSTASRLLRLRGGEGGALQKVQNAYLGVPLLTRSWLSMIVAFAGLNQVGVLPPELLALDSTATMKRLQLWRPLTAASFMGGLGPQLLQKCYYLVQFGNTLERTLGISEYARVLASCTALMCIVCGTLGMQFVGDGLIMAVTVLTCQQSPDQQVNLYGLTIPCAYLPFAQLCMSYLFTQQIPWIDILGALVGYAHYLINDNLKPDAAIYKRDGPPSQPAATVKGAKTLGSISTKKSGASGASGGKTASPRKGSSSGGGGGGSRKSRKANVATFAAACGPGG